MCWAPLTCAVLLIPALYYYVLTPSELYINHVYGTHFTVL